ncbi:MAG: YicC/YloC family endoribonuclease [Thermoguttaceae bacterium]
MLLSMTGFGAASVCFGDVTVTTEIKTVNNRYLKISLRMSEGYAALESKVESFIREKIFRGSVNVSVRIFKEPSARDTRLNEPLLRSYFEQVKEIASSLGVQTVPALDKFLELPGVVHEEKILSEEQTQLIEKAVLKSLDDAFVSLHQMRQVEGESMRVDLTVNNSILEREITKVEALAPQVAKQYRQKLTERVGKIMNEHNLMLDTADLAREIALFADKSDISEEIVRFRSHIAQFAEVLEKEDTCGRKLDFLTQEMFRETNTIGSKSNDSDISKHVIEMKATIERIREMVQNVE